MIRLFGLALVACAVALLVANAGGPGAPPAAVRIDPRVVADTADGRSARFLAVLRSQADVAHATRWAADRDAQGRSAVAALREAAASQAGIRAELDRLGVSYRPYWVLNALAVVGDRRLVTALARRDDIAALEPDRGFAGAAGETMVAVPSVPRGVEWNVAKIGAPDVWALGITGQGMVYANADSGVQWEAPALKSRYRGWDGTTANHAYSWWDAVHGDIDGNGTNPCGFNLRAPCDDDESATSHGTHTMGTAVGDDGAGNQVGVAPGARWIACRAMDQGTGRPSTYIECLQFFLAPTDLDGNNPDPTRRPHVVGNSYSCPPQEGCSVDSLRAAVDNLRAAGVFMSVSTGNEGRLGCGTVADPPAVYESSISVGATDNGDNIAAFSSRGPVNSDGSGRRKPDLVAPGVGIRSTTAGGFGVASGTSMASPHVGGAVLLLWAGLPGLRGNVDATERLLTETAVHLTTTEGCGGDTPTQTPNNTYGSGRIDVAAAFRAAESSLPARLDVAATTVVEGDKGRQPILFAVTLSRASAQSVAVSYATRGGSARSGSDFQATSGRLTFAPGERAKTIAVPALGDREVERDETFQLVLTGPESATLGTALAVGTIRNDDVDRLRPVLTRLVVDPAVARGGARATLRYRLSEPARVVCRVERSLGGAWRRVERLDGRGVRGGNARVLSALVEGRYRTVCRATDPAGNMGRETVARFSVVAA